MNEVCARKYHFDTEFEANRMAAIKEHEWGEEMYAYACGNHWHIAHVKREERNKHNKPVQLFRDYCDICQCKVNPDNYMKHLKKKGHIRNERANAGS